MKKIEDIDEYITNNTLKNIEREGECLIWTGKIYRNIPITFCKKKKVNVRKFYFEKYFGELNDDRLTVLTTCNNNLCVNPKHFFLKDRTIYASDIAKEKAKLISNCPKCGTPKELFVESWNGSKVCGECVRIRSRRKTKKRNTCKRGHSLVDAIIQINGTRRCKTCDALGVFGRKKK